LTIEEARQLAAAIDGKQDLIDAAAEEHSYQAEVAAEFRHLGASDVLGLWESGRNEAGQKLTRVEAMALGEHWAALAGQLLPDLSNGAAPATPRPTAPLLPGPGPGGLDPMVRGFKGLEQFTGLSKSTMQREIKAGRLPPPTKLSVRRVGWPASKVREWREQREAKQYQLRPSRPARQHRGRLH
jgi:predicted DNA-binding transcriptional regulator AlpA